MKFEFDKLISLADLFQDLAQDQLLIVAEEKKKVKNKGKFVFPADSSKVNNHKDYYPINSMDQAKASLSQSNKLTSAPSWFSGSLTSLQEAVRKAVHKAFPAIEINKKK